MKTENNHSHFFEDTKKAVTIEGLLTYLDCPIQYQMKHVANVQRTLTTKQLEKEIFQYALKTTWLHIFASIQVGKTPSLKQVYAKFYHLWQEGQGIPEHNIFLRNPKEAAKRQKDAKERFLNRGYEILKNLYEQFVDDDQLVLAVNHPFTIEVNDLNVSGSFELLREVVDPVTGEKNIELYITNISKNKPSDFFLDHDLTLTFTYLGFLKQFGPVPVNVYLLDMYTQERYLITRKGNELHRFFRVADGFNASSSVPPYPRPGIHCQYCPFLKECGDMSFN